MKKYSFLIVLCVLVLGIAQGSEAATRTELAAIQVERAGDFRYWMPGSPVKAKLVEYVEAVTDPKSRDFIPPADRVAVFDADGTLMCETAPSYFDALMYMERVLDDTSWQAPAELRAAAQETRSALLEHREARLGEEEGEACQLNAFAGMSLTDYRAYVTKFMQEPEQGLSNLNRGEAFYLPMAEVISYLVHNGFKVYIVSACDRMALRVLADGVLPIEPERIIAMNKVSMIAREIGRQPVLAFGNSGGDAGMLNYTIQNNRYRSAAFVLLCDDMDREFGNLKKAQKMQARAEKNGWIPVSMKTEFKTIYGDKVRKVQ